MRECKAFIEATRKVLGPEPEGAHLTIGSNPHDFGTYYDVRCYCDERKEAAMDYAFGCESKAPAPWAEAGMEPPMLEKNSGRM